MRTRILVFLMIALSALAAAQVERKKIPPRALNPIDVFQRNFAATKYSFVTEWASCGRVGRLAVASSGEIFMIDTSDALPCVQVFSLGGAFIRRWNGLDFNSHDRCKGLLESASSLALDANGHIYTSNFLCMVQKYDPAGVFERSWGGRGSGNGQMMDPHDIAVDKNGFVYVADLNNHRIQKFTSDGQWVRSWGTQVTGEGQFTRPLRVAVDPTSKYVYVADYQNERVQKFTSEGVFMTQWRTYGGVQGNGPLPVAVAVDRTGNVYAAVIDPSTNRIQKFAPVLQ